MKPWDGHSSWPLYLVTTAELTQRGSWKSTVRLVLLLTDRETALGASGGPKETEHMSRGTDGVNTSRLRCNASYYDHYNDAVSISEMENVKKRVVQFTVKNDSNVTSALGRLHKLMSTRGGGCHRVRLWIRLHKHRFDVWCVISIAVHTTYLSSDTRTWNYKVRTDWFGWKRRRTVCVWVCLVAVYHATKRVMERP